MLPAEVPSSDNSQQGHAAASESAVEQACERLILETVRLLQEGQLEQADALLIEGAVPCMQILIMNHVLQLSKTAYDKAPAPYKSRHLYQLRNVKLQSFFIRESIGAMTHAGKVTQ